MWNIRAKKNKDSRWRCVRHCLANRQKELRRNNGCTLSKSNLIFTLQRGKERSQETFQKKHMSLFSYLVKKKKKNIEMQFLDFTLLNGLVIKSWFKL